jgi:hypothetical protein
LRLDSNRALNYQMEDAKLSNNLFSVFVRLGKGGLPMRKSAICLAAIIAIIGISGCITLFSKADGKFERTLNVAGPVHLDVFTGSGAIEVKASSAGTVRVYGTIKARGHGRVSAEEKVRYIEAHPPVESSGSTIRIGRIEDAAYQQNVSISYEILVPTDTTLTSRAGSGSQRIDGLHGSVETGTGSGSLSISNIQGDVNAQTGSGSIELHSIAGRLDAHTGSGSINGERIGGSISARTGSGQISLEQRMVEQGSPLDVEAHTGSGSIEVSGVYGSLKASSGSGSIQARGNPVRDWSIHTSSGGVTLEMPHDAAYDLHARTSSGNINVDQPVEVRGNIGRKELQGKVRGGGSLVEVQTSSGSIAIR